MAFIGTDIGGTFTDLVYMAESGEVSIYKAPTTPDDRTRGVIDAMRIAAEDLGQTLEQMVAELQYFAHGTTAATNAFIERKGAKTGLLTTRGFEDTLRIQRAMGGWVGMPNHEISHFSRRRTPDQIIPMDLIQGVNERVDYKGEVIVALDEADARRAIRALLEQGVEAIAISLLWSFRNPAHEAQLVKIIEEEAPHLFVTASSSFVPILGEYERTSTTAINAYLGPVIHHYINGLEQSIRTLGYRGAISIMESSGGVLPAEEAAYQAANLLTSGPAGGVLASQKLGALLGYDNVLTADMGGTSFDVGLIVEGSPLLESVREVGRFHVALPTIKVTAIGAGGGSIARVSDGHLTVGPESAGSVPGPVCYGRGGEEPTITDADIVLGIIDPKYFLGGRMSLDVEAARASIQKFIAEPLGISVNEAAAGIREVANNQMADLLRRVTLRAGYDPRDFVLMAYGGAGATHAHQYASVAGISTIVVPNTGPAHSAFGTVTGDRHRSFSMAFGQHAPARFKRASDFIDVAEMNAQFDQLEQRTFSVLGQEAAVRRFVGLRFRQQVHEIGIEVPLGTLKAENIDQMVDDFEIQYEKIYGKNTALRSSGVEFTVLRVAGTSPVIKPAPLKVDDSGRSHRPVASRAVYFYGHGQEGKRRARSSGQEALAQASDALCFVEADIYRSGDIQVNRPIIGPCIVERPDTTIVVGPGQSIVLEPYGNFLINIQAE